MLGVTEPSPPVVVAGQIARDLVLVVDEVPGPGASTAVRERRELLGGKGANIAVGLSQPESVPEPALLTRGHVAPAANLLRRASTVVLQLQQPAEAVLAALEHLSPDCRVIMDGVPENLLTRDRILAAATVLRLDAREAELLARQPIPDEAAARPVARELLAQGPELVMMADTLTGSHG
jgi:ribokinase